MMLLSGLAVKAHIYYSVLEERTMLYESSRRKFQYLPEDLIDPSLRLILSLLMLLCSQEAVHLLSSTSYHSTISSSGLITPSSFMLG